MNRDRWEAVVTLFERALERPVEERRHFVDSETPGDPELREAVTAMLDADSGTHSLLDASPQRLASLLASGEAARMEGRTIGSYAVLHEIGRGGAATVYLADDLKHHRSVALKVLHTDASSALGGNRFRREIEVVAQLHHPHILPLHDSGEANGHLYYVMPVVTGETLRDRIVREGALPTADVRRIAADVAAALDYAHRHGVIHRDIKPANILLDEEHATVADFGIAHRALEGRDDLTAGGIVVGTPAYMSPEQATGSRSLDARSDIYSLGSVVFEMLTGAPPFRAQEVAELVRLHLQAPVPSAVAVRPQLPARVDDVLRRALAKAPSARYDSAREFVADLDAALTAQAGGTRGLSLADAMTGGRRRWITLSAMAAVVAAAAVWRLAAREAKAQSIVVLPFANLSDDRSNQYFSDGITEEITGALAQLGRFRVTPRTTAFAYKDRTGDLASIGRELGVNRLLEGSVRRDGDRVRIVATLYNVETGDRIWSQHYDRGVGAVLPLQVELAATIAEQLHLRLAREDRDRLAERHTVNPEAYDSYIKGRYFFDQRTNASMTQAVGHFQRALAIDSMYARAHAGLADTYSILAWTGYAAPTELFQLSRQAALRAVALDSGLAESHVSLAIIHTFHGWDWGAAERASLRALSIDSTLVAAWFFRAWHLVAAGRHDDAMVSMRRARQLAPLSLITNARIATLLTWDRQYERADSVLRRTLEIDPSYPVARVQLARVLSAQGRHADAIAALPPDTVMLGSYESGIAGYVYARAGRRDKALAAARALEARAFVPAEGVAAIYVGLGETARALSWLERAVDVRGGGLIFLAWEPMYDDLRDEPRYRRVAERIGVVLPKR
jgi:serine/threonine-protein kinase